MVEFQSFKKVTFYKSEKNPQFADNLRSVRPESCLIANNVNNTPLYIINEYPRRYVYYTKTEFDADDLNYYDSLIDTNSRIQQIKRARASIMAYSSILSWCNNAYIVTLTLAQANNGIRSWLNWYKIQLARKKGFKAQLMGYVWALEFARSGTHPHYHIIMWFDRNVKLKDIKPDQHGWKGRTEVQKVKKKDGATRYLSKYLSKQNRFYCLNWRNYGRGVLKCPLPHKIID